MLGQSVQHVICGLDATLMEHRGRSWCWQLGRIEMGKLVTKTGLCLSIATDGETVAKVCQALAHMKSSERISEARGLLCP